MHFVIGVLIAIASLIYWLGMASRGAREIGSLASDVKNMPRRRRFQKNASKEALDIIEDPVDAAVILMIAVARSDGGGRVSAEEDAMICTLLQETMQWPKDEAANLLLQLKALTSHVILQDTLLFRMIDVLRGQISPDESAELAAMMEQVAQCEGPASLDQTDIIRRFKERMGIGV